MKKKNRKQDSRTPGSLFKRFLAPGIWRKITSVFTALVVFLTTYMMILPALTIDVDTVAEEPGMEVAVAGNDLDQVYSDDAPPGVGESQIGYLEELSESGEPLLESSAAFLGELEAEPFQVEPTSEYAASETGDITDSVIPVDETSPEMFDDSMLPLEEFGGEPIEGIVENPEEFGGEPTEGFVEIPEEFSGEPTEGIVENPEEFGGESTEGFIDIPEEFGEETAEDVVEIPEEITETLPEEQEAIDDVTEEAELIFEDAEASEDTTDETEDADSNTMESAPAHVLKAEGYDYRVTVSYPDEAEIPEGAELLVTEILSDELGYDQYVSEAADALSTEKRIMSVDNARFFDITIIDGDWPVEPKAPVTVLVELADSFAASEDAAVIHYTEEEVKVVETVDPEEAAASIEEAEAADAAAAQAEAEAEEAVSAESSADVSNDTFESEEIIEEIASEEIFGMEEIPLVGAESVEEELPFVGDEPAEEEIFFDEPMKQIAFVADSFSVYGFVTATIEKTILASDGHNYKITVTCGADAGIPEDAELFVREILPEDEKYDIYYESASGAATAQAIERGMSGVPIVSSARFFDIEIRAQGEKLKPASTVRVDIRLLDAKEAEANAVVHFTEQGAEAMDLLENTEADEGVAFETASFSVYSVVDITTIDLENDGPFAIVTSSRGPGISTADGGSSVNRYALTTTTRTRNVNNEPARTTLAGKAVHLDTGKDPYTVGGSVPLWYFEDTGEGTYYIYTEDGGNRQYVTTYYTNLELTDNIASADKFSIAVEDGMLRFGHDIGENSTWYITNEGNNPSYFTQGNNTGNDTLFYLGKLDPDYEEQTAQKVSAADWGGTDFNENSTVMIYRKIVDEHGNESLWALGKDGNFYPIYDGGDAVYYHTTDDIDLEWHIVPTSDGGYWLGSSDGHFINPSLITGGMKWTSTTPASLQLSGMGSDYGTTIENWDQGQYDYVGLHWNAPVDEDSMPTVTPGVGQENDTFLFAVIDQGLIQPGAVHTVDTVDSTSLGVKMTMFNYGGDTYHYGYRNALMQQILGDNMQSDWDHRKGFVTRTVQNKLGSDGFPVGLTNGPEGQGGDSLAPLFSNGSITYTYNNEEKTVPVTGVPANNLFLQSYYDENGTFRYSSLENYAYLNPEPDVNNLYNFTVYREPGTPGVEPTDRTHYYFYHGHFMPYNQIDPNRMVSRVVDQFGWSAKPDEGRTYEDIYGVQGTPDYYFGMSMEADFVQPAGGTLANGDPVVYKFTGDDDLWVFIDGVLVLDVSGIHEALSGSIDFENGEITQPDFYEEGEYFGHHTTTLYEVFRAAGEADKYEWVDVDGNGTLDTFADYSAHTFKMFYMERGAGASNLDLQFNLQVSHPNKFTVRKELPEDIDLDYANVKFEYVAEYWEEDAHAPEGGHWKPLYAGAKIHPNDEHPVCTSVTYENRLDDDHHPVDVPVGAEPRTPGGLEPGHFFLRPGEGAVFEMHDETTVYRVREIHIDRDMYTEVDINGVKVEEAGTESAKYKYEAEQQGPGHDNEKVLYQADAGGAAVRERPYVVYRNVPVTENLRIRKLLTADSLPLEEHDHPQFEFRAYVAQTVMDDGVEKVEIRPYANDIYYLVKEVEPGVEHYFTLTGIDDVTDRQNIPVDTGVVVNDVNPPVICGTTGRSGAMSMIPVGYDIIIPNLLADTSFFIEEVQSEVPEGYTFVEKTVEHASDPDADDYVWRTSASTGKRVQVMDEWGNPARSMGKIENSEHTDALVTAYNRREASDITVEKVWQGVDAEDMDEVTSTMALYVSSEAPSDKYPVTAKVNLVTYNGETLEYEPVSYGRTPSSVQALVSWDGGSEILTLNNDNSWQGTVLVPKEKTATITYSIPGDGNNVDKIGKTVETLSTSEVQTTGITHKTTDEIYANVVPIKTYTLTFVAQDGEGNAPGAGWVKFTYEGHDYLLDMEEGWSKEFTVREDQTYSYKVEADDCDRTFITAVNEVTEAALGEEGTVALPDGNKTIYITVDVVDLTLDFPVSVDWGGEADQVPESAKVSVLFVDTSDRNNQCIVELTNGDWGPKDVSLKRLNDSGRPLTYTVNTWIDNGGTETQRAIITDMVITPTPARANTVSDSVESVIVNGEVASTMMDVPVTVTWTEEDGYTMPQDGKVTVTLTERKKANDSTEPATYSITLNAGDFTGDGRLTWTGTFNDIPRMNNSNDMITYSVTVTPDTASTDTRMMITRTPLSISDFEEGDRLNVEGRVLGPEPVKLRVVLRQSSEYEWYPSDSTFLEYAPGTRVRVRFNKSKDGVAVNWSTSWDNQSGTIQDGYDTGTFWVTLPTETNEYFVYIQNDWGANGVGSLLDVKSEEEVESEPLRLRIVNSQNNEIKGWEEHEIGATVPVTITLNDNAHSNNIVVPYTTDWGVSGNFPQLQPTQSSDDHTRTVLITLPNANGDYTLKISSPYGDNSISNPTIGQETQTTVTIPVSVDMDGVTNQPESVTATFTGSDGSTMNATLLGESWTQDVSFKVMDDYGRSITYTLTSTSVTGGGADGLRVYISSSSPETVDGSTTQVTLTANEASASGTMNVPVSIDWGNVTPPSGATVTVTFMGDGNTYSAEFDGNVDSANETSAWSGSIDLPRFDGNGNLIHYSVTTSASPTTVLATSDVNTIQGDGTVNINAIINAMTLIIRWTGQGSNPNMGALIQTNSDQTERVGDNNGTIGQVGYIQNTNNITFENLSIKTSDNNYCYYAIIANGGFIANTNAAVAGYEPQKANIYANLLWFRAQAGTVTIELQGDSGHTVNTNVSLSAALSGTYSLVPQTSGDVPSVGASVSRMMAPVAHGAEIPLLNSDITSELMADSIGSVPVTGNSTPQLIAVPRDATASDGSEFVALVGDSGSSGSDGGSSGGESGSSGGDSGSSGSDSGSSGGVGGSNAASTYAVYAAGDEPADTFYDAEITAAKRTVDAQPFTTVSSVKDLPEDAELCTHYQIVKGDGGALSYVDGDENTDGIQKVPDTVAVITGDGSYTWHGLPAADDQGNPLYYYVVEHGATADTERIDVDYEYEYNTETKMVEDQPVTEVTGIKKVKVTNTVRKAELKVKKAINAPGADAAKQLTLLGKVSFKIEDVTTGITAGEKTPDITFTFATLAEATSGKTFGLSDGIHYGHTYRVTETVTDDDTNYRYESNSYTITVNGTSGTAVNGTSLTTTTGDITLVNTGAGQYKATGEAAFTNVYSKKIRDIPVTKVWADQDGTCSWPSDVTGVVVTLNAEANGTPISEADLKTLTGLTDLTHTLTATGSSYTWQGLPSYDTAGNEIIYTVDETSVTKGSTVYTGANLPDMFQITQPTATTGAVITNYIGKLTVTKTVKLNEEPTNVLDTEFWVAVYSDATATTLVAGPKKITTSEGTGSVEFDNLFPGTYYVYELTGQNGTPVTGNSLTLGNNTYAVTTNNTDAVITKNDLEGTASIENNKTERGTLIVDKAVLYNGEPDTTMENKVITVGLYKDSNAQTAVMDPANPTNNWTKTITLGGNGTGQVTFESLEFGTYFVFELDKDGEPVTGTTGTLLGVEYNVSYEGNGPALNHDNLTATVSIKNREEETGRLKVTKHVQLNGTDTPVDEAKTFTVGLYEQVDTNWVPVKDPSNASVNWTKVITVPAGESTNTTEVKFEPLTIGKTYRVYELNSNEEILNNAMYLEYVVTYGDDSGVAIVRGDGNKETTVTNNKETTEIDADKTWGNNAIPPAGTTITWTITATDSDNADVTTAALALVEPATTTETETHTVNAAPWTTGWSGLPKVVNGKTVTYDITETAAKYGKYTYTADEIDAANTAKDTEDGHIHFTNSIPTIDFPVRKTWGNGQEPPEGAVITITLEGTVTGGTSVTEEITLNGGAEGGNDTTEKPWEYVWSDLPMYDNDGNEIAYSASETGYTIGNKDFTSLLSGDLAPDTRPADGYLVFTNKVPTTTIKGVKDWTPETLPDGTSVQLTLKATVPGEEVGSDPVDVTENVLSNLSQPTDAAQTITGDGSYEWTSLPMFYTDGQEISYSISETVVTINGTEAWNSTDNNAGINPYLTNTTDTPATATTPRTITFTNEFVSHSVEKEWEGVTDPAYVIQVQLKKDGAAYLEPVVIEKSNDGKWEYTWNYLPKRKAVGEDAVYTVEEIGVYARKADITEDPSTNAKNLIADFKVTTAQNADKTKTTITNELFEVHLLKVDKDDPTKKLGGAVFVLNKEDGGAYGKYVDEKTTPTEGAKKGVLDYTDLPVGKYELVEVHAPTGYAILCKSIKFEIDSDGEIVPDEDLDLNVVSFDDGTFTFTVKNEAGAVLPSTGGPGTNMIYLLGIMFTGLAGIGLVMKRRRRIAA